MSVLLRALERFIPASATPKPVDIPLKEKALTVDQYISQIHTRLMKNKAQCQTLILQLNGQFYQEPSSALKQSWDKVRQTVQAALSVNVDGHDYSSHGRELIPAVQGRLVGDTVIDKHLALRAGTTILGTSGFPGDLSTLTIPTERVEAVDSIDAYLDLEKDRDKFVQQLHDIIRIQKVGKGDLYQEKLNIQARLKQLNGDYFGDPASLLDQAWKAAQETPGLAVGFRVLEAERTEAYARLDEIERLLHAPVSQAVHLYNVTVELYQRKEQLQARLHELCGSYYGDPSSLLDRAWRENRDQHRTLDTERQAIYARLEEVEQQLRLPAHPTMSYQTLAEELQRKKQDEIDRASKKPTAPIKHVDPFDYSRWRF